MLISFVPGLVPVPLLVSAVVGFMNTKPRPKILPKLTEASALLAFLMAIVSAGGLVIFGTTVSPMIGFYGAGLSARLDAVSAVMLLLVTFIGWVVVRYACPGSNVVGQIG